MPTGEKKGARQPKKVKGPAVPKKKRRRKNSWDYEDDDGDVEFEAQDSGSESEEKPKKKRARPRKPQVEKVKAVDPVRKKKAALKEVQDEEEEQDHVLAPDKFWSRLQQYEQDSEQLLQEVRDLAMQEKKSQGKLVEKLKRDVTTLSKQAEEARKKRTKEVDRLVADKMREYDVEQRKRNDRDEEKKALRERIKELESQFASFKRSTGPDDVVTVNAAASDASAIQNSEAIVQLDQANKLLEAYRLVTSTELRLIPVTGNNEPNSDDCIEIACTITNSATRDQLDFELSVPAVASSDIEYLPSEKPPTGIQVPSYLRGELSFRRSEVTKFFRSVLDVVSRKKKN